MAMALRSVVGGLLLAMALAACGEGPAPKAPAPPPAAAAENPLLPDAIPYSDAVGQPAAIILPPYNLPLYAPVRPGATIESAQSAAPSGGAGGLVSFRTPAGATEIAHFYRGQLEREFGSVSDAESAGVRLLTAARAGSVERVDISVAPAAEGGSRVTISYVLPR
jgi:hypothetical protein